MEEAIIMSAKEALIPVLLTALIPSYQKTLDKSPNNYYA